MNTKDDIHDSIKELFAKRRWLTAVDFRVLRVYPYAIHRLGGVVARRRPRSAAALLSPLQRLRR